MKACVFCGAQIQDTARKCRYCHSFQNPDDAPRRGLGMDVASLVVSFVGVITIVGGIVAGTLGYLGFKTVSDSNELNQKVTEKIKTYDESIKKFERKVAELEQKATVAQTNLNGVSVAQLYGQFQELFDSVELDNAGKFSAQIERLNAIANSSAAALPAPHDVEKDVYEMKVVSLAVAKYRDVLKGDDEDGYLTIVDMLGGLPDENLNKDRILAGAYSHLYDIAQRAGKSDAQIYFGWEKHYSFGEMTAAQRFNRQAIIAKVNYGGTLIDSRDPKDWEDGYKLMLDARKDAPQNSIIYYNLAEYFIKKNDPANSIANLEVAKNFGDFATCDDLRHWMKDTDFDALRQIADPAIQARIRKLQDIGGAQCP